MNGEHSNAPAPLATDQCLYSDMVRYARGVAEHFPGACEQIELHLESNFPEASALEIMYAAQEAVDGAR